MSKESLIQLRNHLVSAPDVNDYSYLQDLDEPDLTPAVLTATAQERDPLRAVQFGHSWRASAIWSCNPVIICCMQPDCHEGGREPVTIDVNAKTCPMDVVGSGKGAGSVTW